MAITDDIILPSDEELTVPELVVGSPILRAAAPHLGKYCDNQCKEFMLCKQEERDPRRCLEDGKAVTACAFEFFKKVKKSCREELENYAKCLTWTSDQLRHENCRGNQGIYEECMINKLGIERAPFGYFSQIRLHDSKREKPKPNWPDFLGDKVPGLTKERHEDMKKQQSRRPGVE